MPMIDFTYPEGALTAEGRTEAVERLTTAILEHEGVPDNEHSRLFSWCYVHELPDHAINIGGRPSEKPIYRVAVAVPHSTQIHGQAPWATARRRALAREVTEIVLEAEGTEYSPADAWRVWVIMHEVDEGFWSMAGTLFRFEDLVSYIAPEHVQTTVGGRLRQAADEALSARQV
jgi:phenylpyruvate tautomerase PptA (4-oxalocrotonate tautomerase family)